MDRLILEAFFKQAAFDLGAIGKEYVLPSMVAGPAVGAAVTKLTSKDNAAFKKNVTKGMGTGLVADMATGAALGAYHQRKEIVAGAKKLFKMADLSNLAKEVLNEKDNK